MDIDLFCSIGGLFGFFLYPNICMAAALKVDRPSPISSFDNISRTRHFLKLFGLLFMILVVFVSSSGGPSKPSDLDIAASPKTLFSETYAGKIDSHDQTADLGAGKRENGHIPYHALKSKGKDRGSWYESSDHEVPSGPNPISNK
ncbi:Unknown protein [Striga hermonthica]|uniref:Uncharacterized protein n=1 Tax=Striga hermonthica TaxID=68872 RepID=A0A9N7N0E4_STRHE|nr:Unknown protein [Striga hermonthica]